MFTSGDESVNENPINNWPLQSKAALQKTTVVMYFNFQAVAIQRIQKMIQNYSGIPNTTAAQKAGYLVCSKKGHYTTRFLQQPQALSSTSRHNFFSFLFFCFLGTLSEITTCVCVCVCVWQFRVYTCVYNCIYMFIHMYTCVYTYAYVIESAKTFFW